MKFSQPPLKIDCNGLSKKLIFDLADRLALHFENVETFSDVIYCHKPLPGFHYDKAWRIIDLFNVSVI